MIIGAHSIIYSKNAEADRAFLRDVLGLPHVDVGFGWLIFGLPPAEVAVHPHDKNNLHEFYLMVEDVETFVADMKERGISCSKVQSMAWGALTQLKLPGGGKVGVYQPRHARPESMTPAARRRGGESRGVGATKPRAQGGAPKSARPARDKAATRDAAGGKPSRTPARKAVRRKTTTT